MKVTKNDICNIEDVMNILISRRVPFEFTGSEIILRTWIPNVKVYHDKYSGKLIFMDDDNFGVDIETFIKNLNKI